MTLGSLKIRLSVDDYLGELKLSSMASTTARVNNDEPNCLWELL